MNLNELQLELLKYNQPTKMNYKYIKTKRIKRLDGSVITQYFYKGILLFEK